ncbi:MAG: FAD-dependent thymidylate synthase [candidate division Zixibacteria bacterium]|nr:FAD-dependent thymidylate synthase [candidate division Zixibacteria bacterium]
MAKNLSDLKHTAVNIKDGGEVIVLDTGSVIDAEAEAMLQALHSRSTGGLRSHLEILAEKGADNFMEKFYVGYGHHSIGDCGDTTIFIEGVSMPAVKAVQDNPLFRGQESSTRYLDFSQQPFIDPTKTEAGNALLERQRQFYIDAMEPTRECLRKLHPRKDDEKKSIHNKAIDARAFDITRSLLPAGASTNIAWHTDLRQASDKLLFLMHHPLPEVRNIASAVKEALHKHHPHSFGHEIPDETEMYQDLIAESYYYHDPKCPDEPIVNFKNIDLNELKKYDNIFKNRPPKTGLPKFVGQIGTLEIEYRLDFGSFRDIQRHRAITQRMPLLTTSLGFNQWYIDNLPEVVREKLPEHLKMIENTIGDFKISREQQQFFIPIGYNTSNRFTGDLPATVYMVEIRDSRFVHPTLQKVAHSIGKQITKHLGIRLNVDPEPNRFDVKRGEQDIVAVDE